MSTSLQVGQCAEITKTFTPQDVETFASLVGDHNPIHLDQDYAAKSSFEKCIVHGMLVAGLISAVFSEKLPGPGTVYLNQTIQFKEPVFLNDTITASVEVLSVRMSARLGKPIVTFRTVCKNQHDLIILDGEAVLLLSKSE